MRYKTAGFSLIELMITVAIIGILASVAIPQFLHMQLRAKRAELPTNLEAIRVVEVAYHHEWDSFTAAAMVPARIPGRTAVPFRGPGLTAWELLGWTADGKVYGAYSASLLRTPRTASTRYSNGMIGNAMSDADGDRNVALYSVREDLPPSLRTPNNLY